MGEDLSLRSHQLHRTAIPDTILAEDFEECWAMDCRDTAMRRHNVQAQTTFAHDISV
jgi:hypothetical protein